MSSNLLAYETEASTPLFWNTLESLQTLAMAGGCTKAQFAEAVETMGTNPCYVADYLQRYALTWKVPKGIQSLAIRRSGR